MGKLIVIKMQLCFKTLVVMSYSKLDIDRLRHS